MRPPGLLAALIVSAAIGVLETACQTGLLQHSVVLPPSEIAASLWNILQSGAFNRAIFLTLSNIFITAALAIFFGFVVGVLLHSVSYLRAGLEPFLASYYAIPTFIFYPVFIVLFGVGSASIIAISVLLAIVAMITATLSGLDRVPIVLRKTAKVMRLNTLETAVSILLPSALPYLVTGARLAIAYAFIGVIASEFILSDQGVGYAISYAYNNFDNQTMYGLILLIILIVVGTNMLLDAFDRRQPAQTARNR